MKKVFKVAIRFTQETETWLAVATNYCKFRYGLDRRGRGHGSTASELKDLEKSIVSKFKTIENCRQWLAKVGTILVVDGDKHSEIRVGNDENSFSLAIEKAKNITSDWKETQGVCLFFESVGEANRYLRNHEAYLVGPYALM